MKNYFVGSFIRQMRLRNLGLLVLLAALLVPQRSVSAFETDQYDLPPQPLEDIGNEVSEHILNPVIALTISPTVNLYGSEFGTDKIAHIFQQGYTYYKIYRQALAEGVTPEEARLKAVSWGQKSERTFYGTLVAGVYSNGDLSANYAGLKFYEGLTHPVRLGDATRPAVLELQDGFWKFADNPNIREVLLKPFVSDHLNEALNPSIFTRNLGWRAYIRWSVRKRSCEQWINRYPQISRAGLEERSRALRLWYGEDYGFTESEHFITIANTCFENEVARASRP